MSTCVAAAIAALTIAAVSAQAQTTAFYYDSQPGDSIGQGQQQTLTQTEVQFSTSASMDRSEVTISPRSADFSVWWFVELGNRSGLPLAPGAYESASRFQSIVSPSMDIFGMGRGCNQTFGRFVVYEIEFEPTGFLTRFAADFEQHCEGGAAALIGAIRYNSTRASLNPFDGVAPVIDIHLDQAINGYVTGPGLDCGAGRTDCEETFAVATSIALQAVPSPGYVFLGWAGADCVGDANVGIVVSRRMFCTPVFNVAPSGVGTESPDYSDAAFFLDSALGTGEATPTGNRVRQVYVTSPAGSPVASAIRVQSATSSLVHFRITGPRRVEWNITFEAPSEAELAPGLYRYTVTSRWPGDRSPVLEMYGGSSNCDGGGRFQVYEIAFSDGELTRFAADFELPCGYPTAPAAGSIRYHSTRSSLLPFEGAYPLLALQVVPTLGGYVTSAGISCGDGGRVDCEETYGTSTVVPLQAFPSSGYEFVGWSGSCSGGNATTTATVNKAERCFAVFTPSGIGSDPADPTLGAATLLIDAPGSSSPAPSRRLWVSANTSVYAGVSFDRSSVSFFFRDSASGDSETVQFSSPVGPLVTGDYEEAYDSRWPGFPAMQVANCYDSVGRFRIYEMSFDDAGRLQSFAADFEALCGLASMPYVVGAVRFNSTRFPILPFDGNYPIYKLTIQPAPNGFVTSLGLDCGPGRADCTEFYEPSTPVTLVATPADGYRFMGWIGACSGRSTTTVVVVDWIRRCAAVFTALAAGSGIEDPRVRTHALLIDSEPGEPIGRGLRRILLDGRISAFGSDFATVSYEAPDGEYWRISLRAAAGLDLRPGAYDDAVSAYSAHGAHPGLNVSRSGSLCGSGVTGRFVIHEISFDSPGSTLITALAVDFQQRCGTGPYLFGSIRYNSNRSQLGFAPAPASAMPGDLSADASPDLIWQNRSDGMLGVWYLSGTTPAGTALMLPDRIADINWHMVGSADADRDGYTDLYWQHQTTGTLAIWFMRENWHLRSGLLTPSSVGDTRWKVRSVTDMDDDGYPDVIWQHTGTGHVAVWFMTGTSLRSSQLLSPGVVSDLNWRIVGAGDANGDNRPDLFWHHAATGHIAVWLMDGGTMTSTHLLTPRQVSDLNWQVRGVADLDGNGSADLIWQNTATQQIGLWLMQGTQLSTSRALAGPSGASWHIVGPK